MQSFRVTVLLVWILGSPAGILYSRYHDIPLLVTIPVLVAILVELTLYSGLAFPEVRSWWERLGGRLPWLMAASGVIPYLLVTPAVGTFSWKWLAVLLAVAAVVAWWFRLLPRNAVTDLGFLALVIGVYLSKIFHQIYPPPVEGLRIEVIGQLMLIRLGTLATLVFRRMDGIGFGFVPTRREWLVGIRHWLLFLPLGVVLMYSLEFAHFEPANGWWWKAAGTFVGIFWVVALGEELFFRGMLQQWLMGWMGIRTGLVVTAVVFGLCHLPFREFPNWRFAILATAAGWFYGRAFLEGKGIRAAMVAHALTVATWRTLFR